MTDREKTLVIATLEVLSQMGSLLLAKSHVVRGVRLKTAPTATPTEVDAALQWTEARDLILSHRDEWDGLKYKLTGEGKAWLQEHA